jgi:hypothetical protein
MTELKSEGPKNRGARSMSTADWYTLAEILLYSLDFGTHPFCICNPYADVPTLLYEFGQSKNDKQNVALSWQEMINIFWFFKLDRLLSPIIDILVATNYLPIWRNLPIFFNLLGNRYINTNLWAISSLQEVIMKWDRIMGDQNWERYQYRVSHTWI